MHVPTKLFLALVLNLLGGLLFTPVGPAQAADWLRFRGPNGTGIGTDSQPLPTEWGPEKNIRWKVALPGPGSSSPIVLGERIYVTCWSGYGVDRNDPGDPQKLVRHLLCIDRKSGQIVWDKTVSAVLPEDEYGGMFAEHGYASHTPVTDGERIYVYFGKTGALAFDLEGNQLWQTPVGTESDPRGWGSASSPILYEDLVIITASAESEAMVALSKKTGEVVWRKEAQGFGSTWGTPILVPVDAQRTDLVLGVPNEIWGFDPATGKLRWYCTAMNTDSFCSSVVSDGQVVYAIEGRGGGSIAVRTGGEGDVTGSHVVWQGRDSNRIGTPIVHEGLLYFVSNRVARCVDAKSGESIYEQRLNADGLSSGAPEPSPGPGPGPGGAGGGGGRGGRRGGMGGQDYASPIAADQKIYYVTRAGIVYVWALGREFRQLGANRLTTDTEDFSATPAVSQGDLLIRSSKHLYCIANPSTGG